MERGRISRIKGLFSRLNTLRISWILGFLRLVIRIFAKKPVPGSLPSIPEQLFNKIKKDYLFYFSRRLNKVMVTPEMIQIMLTSKCNIKCKMCDVWKQQFRDELTAEEVKGLIDQAIEMGVKTIYFTGGEAFLRRDIFELIDYATRPGMITTVNTNGSFITKEMAEKIVLSKLRSIQFSIDSPIAEKHNFMRGKNVFEKAVQAMEYINYYKERLGRRAEDNLEGGLDMVIVSVIMKSNIEELAGLVELAEKTQCCGILFQPLINNGNLLENFNFDSDFWVEEEDVPRLEETFRKLEQMKNQMPPGVFIEFMPEKTIQHFRRQRRANTCFAGFNRIFVNPQGDISFVCFPSFGNVRANRLENVWHSEKAYEFRERLKNCQVNCTQFCSERPASESIEAIHRSLLEGIKKFPKKTQIKLLIKEYIFLQSIPILNNWSNRNNYDHKKEKAS